jgi:hypothetical protein
MGWFFVLDGVRGPKGPGFLWAWAGRRHDRSLDELDDATDELAHDQPALAACYGALIPPPRLHLLRYHGVLAAHANARSEVVPRSRARQPNRRS